MTEYVDPVLVRWLDSSKRKHRYEDLQQKCGACGETKSVKSFGELEYQKVCKRCRTNQVEPYRKSQRRVEFTWLQYVRLKGFTEHQRRVIKRAAEAYRSFAHWAARRKDKSERYQGKTASDIIAPYEEVDPALAARMYTAVVILVKEWEEAA